MTNARPHPVVAARPHYVYRVFDAKDRVLYIGCSRDPWSRLSCHRSFGNPNRSSAAIQMYGVREEVTKYPTYDEARAAEKAAIYDEAPYFNFAHNGRRFRGRASEQVEILPTYEPAKREPTPDEQWILDFIFGSPDKAPTS